jgi:hypothetical protein
MDDKSEFSVHVETDAKDYMAAQKVLCRGQYARWRTTLWLLPAIIVLLVIMFGLQFLFEEIFKLDSMIALLVAIPPAWFAYFQMWQLFNRFRVKTLLDRRGSFLSPVEISLADDGVHWSNHRGEGRTAWHAVPRVVETKAHVYIFIDKAAAHVIPKRCFTDEAAINSFVSTARRYADAAQSAVQ